jgi:P27 family predicted phage terminase small subunit
MTGIGPAAFRLHQPVTASLPPEAPAHLGEPEKQVWAAVHRDFDLPTETALAILTTGLESHMRARLAREQVDKDGMTIEGRDGQEKVHPLLGVERDARSGFLQAIKLLGLDL